MSKDDFEFYMFQQHAKDGLMRFLWRLLGPCKDEFQLLREIHELRQDLEREKKEVQWQEDMNAKWMDRYNEMCAEVDKRDRLIRDLRIRLSEASRNLTRLQKLKLP